MQTFAGSVDQVFGAGFASDLELGIVHVDRDCIGAAKGRGCNGTEADAAAAEDRDGVFGGDAAAGDGVEAYGERFYEAELFDGEVGGVELFARYADVLRHGAVALYAHRLIPLAGVDAAAKTCSARCRSLCRARW